MNSYKALNKQEFSSGDFSIVPIRMKDRYAIMKWRNEQMFHLRQSKPLTKEIQDNYFDTVISDLFDQKEPSQILFSYLKDDKCIGYGGLVHINWIDRNAEISFVLDTQLEEKLFDFHWTSFLGMIEKIAFEEIKFKKIFTYAFDLRPHLYSVLEKADFYQEAVLKDHCFFNGEYIDVVIHSKIFDEIKYKEATLHNAETLFKWANDKEVRKNSINPEPISWNHHVLWLTNKILDKNSRIFIFFKYGKPIGQVRLDLKGQAWEIDYSIDTSERGKGYGTKILSQLIKSNEFKNYRAVVKKQNLGSIKVFKKLGFQDTGTKKMIDSGLLEFHYNR